MTQPKVTVIMTTYNRQQYIREAIQSVLNQTFTDFELIVVDDGSTDNTQHLVQTFDDKRIRYTHQEHRGISAAMNTGIGTAVGEYIARLDSDDMWLPDMLETEVMVLDKRPEIGLVYARAQAIDKDGNLLPAMRGLPEWYPGDSFRSMLMMDITSNITVLLRHSCFDRIGLYEESLNVNEDWDMWLRVAAHYRFAFVDRVLGRFRYHDGNITSRSSPFLVEHLDGRVRILDRVFSQPDLPPDILAMKPAAYKSLYLWVGRCWLDLKEYKRFLRCFWCAVRISGNPPLTLVQIAWILIVDKVLWRFSWGRNLAEGMADLTRSIRNKKVFRRGKERNPL